MMHASPKIDTISILFISALQLDDRFRIIKCITGYCIVHTETVYDETASAVYSSILDVVILYVFDDDSWRAAGWHWKILHNLLPPCRDFTVESNYSLRSIF